MAATRERTAHGELTPVVGETFRLENAGAAQAAIVDFAGHAGQRAQGINRVVVADQKNGPTIDAPLSGCGEVDLQTVAKVEAAMEVSASAQGFELWGEEGGDAVDCGLVVARGFDFDELANRVDYLVSMFRETAEAIGPRGLGDDHG